ncbi:hypothetical protein [Paraburkholderia sp. SUR17]|uniref:hypothetical protein n=1 Tax=Paraburkholderia sp. SUR17 TaxID=3034358 RepID=UPI002407B4F7|nr:hypothetical protein [Paraburkholderia sp. SUR17]WEY37764.1 hypothetical protein P2869_11820 [Paraburkholderia sp. SUR17]
MGLAQNIAACRRWRRPLAATALAALLCYSQGAIADIELGGFRLGEGKDNVLAMAREQIGPAEATHAERYQVPRDFYQVTPPKSGFQLCGAPVTAIRMYFDTSDRLTQVDLDLDTAETEVIHCLIPDVGKAKPTGSFGDTWEIQRPDGEIVYAISASFRSTTVEFADRRQAEVNSSVRRRSDQRFKELRTKFDEVIELMKNANKPFGQ